MYKFKQLLYYSRISKELVRNDTLKARPMGSVMKLSVKTWALVRIARWGQVERKGIRMKSLLVLFSVLVGVNAFALGGNQGDPCTADCWDANGNKFGSCTGKVDQYGACDCSCPTQAAILNNTGGIKPIKSLQLRK